MEGWNKTDYDARLASALKALAWILGTQSILHLTPHNPLIIIFTTPDASSPAPAPEKPGAELGVDKAEALINLLSCHALLVCFET